MGLRILTDENNDNAVFFCSSTMWAIGPVFISSDTHTASERADSFSRFVSRDMRQLDEVELTLKYSDWLSQEDKQWEAEKRAEQDKYDTE